MNLDEFRTSAQIAANRTGKLREEMLAFLTYPLLELAQESGDAVIIANQFNDLISGVEEIRKRLINLADFGQMDKKKL